MKELALKTEHFHTKLACQKSMLRQIEWRVHNGSVTRNRGFPVTTLFLRKFCFSLRTSYKELIWCTIYPNVDIHTFRKRWSFIWEWFFPVSIFNVFDTDTSSKIRISVILLYECHGAGAIRVNSLEMLYKHFRFESPQNFKVFLIFVSFASIKSLCILWDNLHTQTNFIVFLPNQANTEVLQSFKILRIPWYFRKSNYFHK